MTLRRKILFRVYVLTFLVILAMSVTYYYVFTRDIRERSQQNVEMGFAQIFDDLRTRVTNVTSKIDLFMQSSLVSPVYVVQMFQAQQRSAAKPVELNDVKRVLTYLYSICDRMRDFGPLIEASEMLVYTKDRALLAAYRHAQDQNETWVYLPELDPEAVIPIQTDTRWHATLQTLEDIPLVSLPEQLPMMFENEIPEATDIHLSALHELLTVQFAAPIIERGNVQGVFVIHLAIRQNDVERYARLSGTEINVFSGSALSVGTLSTYNFLAPDLTRHRSSVDLFTTPDMPAIDVAGNRIRGDSYYQGTLAFGEAEQLLGGLTVLFPRSLEEQQKRRFLMIVAVVTLIFSVVVAFEALGLSSAIGTPIAHLMTAMQTIKTGNLDVQAPVETDDEIGRLAETFNSMAIKLKASIARIEEQRYEVEHQNQELQRMNSEVERQNQELQRMDRLKDEFLANTSHELRTPLNGIAGLAQAILSGADGPLTEDEHRHVKMILQSSTRLTNLVTGLLDFSKAKSEQIQLHIAPFPLREVTEVVCAFSRELLHDKPVELRVNLPDDLPEIYADIDRVEQILTNLVGNAIKFTKEGTITISAERHNDWLCISVADTGVGIPEEALERIFNPFEQADGSITREFGGTGLGLAITKELVNLHGGHIWVQSEAGAGSTFSVTLPCTEQAASEAARAQASRGDVTVDMSPQSAGTAITMPTPPLQEEGFPEESLAAEVSGKGHTIVVIDDDLTNVEVLRTQLAHAGFTVLTATSGQEAFEVINGYEVDVILCDVMMPVVDGYTFAMRMREQEHLKDIPLVFVSAKDQKQDIMKGYTAGAVEYLVKPVAHDELLLKVQALVEMRQRTRARYVPPGAIRTVDHLYDVEQEKDDQFTTIRNGDGETILVVDDEPINVEVLKTQLRQHRYQVITAANGPEALEKIRAERPHLVILDLMMPKMSGFRVCQTLRGELQLRDLPVIMLTAKSNIYDKVYGLNIGANDYVIKPFHLDELLTRIHVLLNITRLQRELTGMNESLRTEVIERQQAEEALREEVAEHQKTSAKLAKLNRDLEQIVDERTAELTMTIESLKKTQHHLVQSEKMAALGGLVAGIAHQLNTPVGVGITAASFLNEQSEDLQAWYAERQISDVKLEKYLNVAGETSRMILQNLQRVARQIQNFKQAAVDQSEVGRRSFAVKPYLEDTLRTLQSQLQETRHQVTVAGDESLTIESYPGALSQVVTSLVMNSIAHAYRKSEQGHLRFEMMQQQDRLLLKYTDDGCGIPREHLPRIFEPFFTTALGTGGSGLGLHIVYNLVTHKLKGTIQCESQMGEGTTFVLNLPLSLPHKT